MINDMFWYKYQPKSLKTIILLPRVYDLVKDGNIKTNMIFYSDTPGTGKTTLAKILCKNTDNIEFNASQDTSINILREQLKNHCKTLNPLLGKNIQKTIFLDEFDGVSAEYQKALKGFSDEYQHVRFILTTNYIEKIDDKILSRFIKVDFNPKNKSEIEYLNDKYLKYLKAISSKIKMDISDNDLKQLISLSFPDLRSATQKLQEIYITKNNDQFKQFDDSDTENVFNFILNGKNDVVENYNFVINNYQNYPEELMRILGRPLFNKIMNIDSENLIKKGAMLINIQKTYNENYKDTIDPIIHLISYITDIKEVIKNLK